MCESKGLRALSLSIGGRPSVKTCIIPCAGSAPDLFPATLVTPPSLFPIVDAHGLAQPAVVLLVEEAVLPYPPRIPRAPAHLRRVAAAVSETLLQLACR